MYTHHNITEQYGYAIILLKIYTAQKWTAFFLRLYQKFSHYIISIIYHRRLSRKTVKHTVAIHRKRNHTDHSQPEGCAFGIHAPCIAVEKEPEQKQNPQRRRGVEIHSSGKLPCQNIKYCARHAAACTGKACQNKLRTECMEQASRKHIIQNQRENSCFEVPQILPESLPQSPHNPPYRSPYRSLLLLPHIGGHVNLRRGVCP